ncbi:NUDIX hydrolase [Halobacteriales archaeon QS_4_62_28]|nr:MAG: NUDIX hydrolase [Halobacteriales archaeon QS_4_62_28]
MNGGQDDTSEWPVHDRVVVWENEFFDAGYDVVERPDGERVNYYWIDPADVTVIVPVTDGEVVLVETYSPHLRGTILGCPAGAVELGERPEEAAARELREETGYSAGTLTEIETVQAEAWVRSECSAFVATDLQPGEQELDDGEYLTVQRVPIPDAIDAIRSFDAVHGVQLLPLLLAREDGLL